jgi:hypothetical protein
MCGSGPDPADHGLCRGEPPRWPTRLPGQETVARARRPRLVAHAATAASRISSRAHPFTPTPHAVDVAGLAELPNPVVALTAVPDVGARPSLTRPPPWGAWGLAVVPIHLRRVSIGRCVEIHSAVREGGDPSCSSGVTGSCPPRSRSGSRRSPAQLDSWSPCGRCSGPQDSGVGTRQRRPRPEPPCPRVGDGRQRNHGVR